MFRLSYSAHRLEHRWSKVTQDLEKSKPGLAFGMSCHRPFKGFGESTTSLWCDCLATTGVHRRSLELDGIELLWEKEAWELIPE